MIQIVEELLKLIIANSLDWKNPYQWDISRSVRDLSVNRADMLEDTGDMTQVDLAMMEDIWIKVMAMDLMMGTDPMTAMAHMIAMDTSAMVEVDMEVGVVTVAVNR